MKNQITQSIKNLIKFLARKYSRGDKWKFDEITQELYMSVLKSDENFKEGMGACFQTYAIGNIKFTMFTILGNNNNNKTSDFKDFSGGDFLDDCNENYFDFSLVFEKRTAEIFNLRFNKELTLKEISQKMNVSHQRIYQIINVNKKNKKLLKMLKGE